MGFASLKFNGDETAKIGTFDTPTSAGNLTVSGLGHTPKFLILVGTTVVDENTIETFEDAEGFCLSYVAGHAEECHGYSIEDAADPTNTGSFHVASALDVRFNNGDAGADEAYVASGPSGSGSFDADSFTLNFSTVDTVARKVMYLSVGAPDPVGPERPAIFWRGVGGQSRAGF